MLSGQVFQLEPRLYYDDVAIMNAGIDHGIAFDPQKESGGFVLNQQFIEIEDVFDIVVSRRWEPRRYGMRKHRDAS